MIQSPNHIRAYPKPSLAAPKARISPLDNFSQFDIFILVTAIRPQMELLPVGRDTKNDKVLDRKNQLTSTAVILREIRLLQTDLRVSTGL